jgi:AhpD family alkylhydroperoxidase
MKPRLEPFAAAPAMMRAMLDLEAKAAGSGLEKSLIELIKMRASQINGCAYCIHMHGTDALKAGESPLRLMLLDAFRESPLFSPRERAALAWTEALTRVAETHAPDEDYAAVQAEFSPEEQVKLTLMIVTINAWNRFAIGFRSVHPVTG